MKKKWTRRGALALMGSGAGIAIAGSGSFTETETDRPANVDTSGDGPSSTALLGINTFGNQLAFEAETREIARLTNNTGETLDTVSASVANNSALAFDVTVDSTPGSLAPASSGTVTATATGANSDCVVQMDSVELDIFASSSSGSATNITATRTVDLSLVNCINFEPSGTSTPAGFVPDAGNQFALRDAFDSESTLEYGWNRDQTAATRERNTDPTTEDDTLIHFNADGRIPSPYDASQDGFWEFDLPAGWYDVRMRCSEPDYLDSEYSFDVDGGAAVVPLRDPEFDDQQNQRTNNAETYNFTVEVASGDVLNITPPAGTYNPKISWLQFQSRDDTPQEANFAVTITASDDYVDEGDTVTVDTEITNTGDQRDIQSVTLDVAGQGQVDSTTVALKPAVTTQIQLEWDTGAANATPGTYDLTAASEDTSDTATTEISGDVEYSGGTASTGERGRYEQDVVFDIVNNRAREIEFTGLRVESTNTAADRLDNTSEKETFVWVTSGYDPNSRGDHDYENQQNNGPPYDIVDGGQSDRADLVPNGSTETLAPGDTATVEVTGFRDDGGPITMGGTEVSDIKIGSKTNIGGTTLDVTLFFETPDGTERSKTLTIDGVTGDLEYIRGSAVTFDAKGTNDGIAFNLLNNDAKSFGAGTEVGFDQFTVESTTSSDAFNFDNGTTDLLAAVSGTSADYIEDGGFDGYEIGETIPLPADPDQPAGEDSRWNVRGFETRYFDSPVDMSGEDVLITIERENSSAPGGAIRFRIENL
ncbi:hypothetical protein [Halorientalis litorea]|uniref:hypothetical protein n=1 Tax=Halorientalis litorea TaxID=2931977 RepID=UPI001FF5247D|nr:hypothetical protein [Halorientalis litorea]